ncbi:membrane bound O-acyl transferase, MBOAT [Kipferlia bialata]|uniref:Membrane bound O-acyl transferase, MBOAT n=1 Tax=Kipferlia bialata TaxID=797122 RepID=A0A9K3CQP7_9EUKA|nr:membrane bound O-acyl transferase, MBOAT [Kipferlia bialata]|eukprot:g1941.t1
MYAQNLYPAYERIRTAYGLFFGILAGSFSYRTSYIWTLLSQVITWVILRIPFKNKGLPVLLFNIAFLGTFTTMRYYFTPTFHGLVQSDHWLGMQMIMFLGMTSGTRHHLYVFYHPPSPPVGFDCHDSGSKPPGLFEFLAFANWFTHILVGPFVPFKEWRKFIHTSGSPTGTLRRIWNVIKYYLWSIGSLAVYTVWTAPGTFGIDADGSFYDMLMEEDRFKDTPLYSRLLLLIMGAVALRHRYYLCWDATHASLVASAEAWDAEKGDYTRWLNIRVSKVELAPNLSQLTRYWNAGTSYWLATYIYKRSFNWMKSKGVKAGPAKTLAVLITDVVSALWHGPYPSFMCFFVFCAILTFANRATAKVCQATLWTLYHSGSRSTVRLGWVLSKGYYVCGVLCVHIGMDHMAGLFCYHDVHLWIRTLSFVKFVPVWLLATTVPVTLIGKVPVVKRIVTSHQAYLKTERETKLAKVETEPNAPSVSDSAVSQVEGVKAKVE